VQPALSTSRLVLRPVDVEDFSYLHGLWSESLVRRYLFNDRFVSLELARSVLATCLEGRGRGTGLWIVQSNDGSERVGFAGLNLTGAVAAAEPRLKGLLEPVIALHPSRWNQGYALESLACLLTYAFDTLDQERLAGASDVPNVASVRMLTRLGFTRLSEVQGRRHLLRTYLLTRVDWCKQRTAR